MPVAARHVWTGGEFAFDIRRIASRIRTTTRRSCKGDLTATLTGASDRAADFEQEPTLTFGNAAASIGTRPFTTALWVLPGGPTGDWKSSQRYGNLRSRVLDMNIALDYSGKQDCQLSSFDARRGPDSRIEVKSHEGVTLTEWNHLAVAYDGSGKAKGFRSISMAARSEQRSCTTTCRAIRDGEPTADRQQEHGRRRSKARSTTCASTTARLPERSRINWGVESRSHHSSDCARKTDRRSEEDGCAIISCRERRTGPRHQLNVDRSSQNEGSTT